MKIGKRTHDSQLEQNSEKATPAESGNNMAKVHDHSAKHAALRFQSASIFLTGRFLNKEGGIWRLDSTEVHDEGKLSVDQSLETA